MEATEDLGFRQSSGRHGLGLNPEAWGHSLPQFQQRPHGRTPRNALLCGQPPLISANRVPSTPTTAWLPWGFFSGQNVPCTCCKGHNVQTHAWCLTVPRHRLLVNG